MARLEDLTPGARVTGVVAGQAVTVVATEWHGNAALTLTFRDDAGRPGEQLLYRVDEPTLAVDVAGPAWSLTADGALFRLVSEARRIQLAYLFDPMLAVSNSNVMPLPHQISAVYEEMLTRQPLHFLLADDPGAGKTIMAGLLIKELMVRGDAKRVLIVCPGMLVDQWQDELREKFHLGFEIVTRQMIDASYAGNPFLEKDLLIARLDHLSRNEELLAKLSQSDWDLVICDEAHKMSAHYLGSEVMQGLRYRAEPMTMAKIQWTSVPKTMRLGSWTHTHGCIGHRKLSVRRDHERPWAFGDSMVSSTGTHLPVESVFGSPWNQCSVLSGTCADGDSRTASERADSTVKRHCGKIMNTPDSGRLEAIEAKRLPHLPLSRQRGGSVRSTRHASSTPQRGATDWPGCSWGDERSS